MPVALNREIRKTLNDVVRRARIAAEDGAQAALRQLGVADAKRPTWLSETDAALRVRLRAHAKTLGDALDSGDPARMPRLVREIAYAHWHRALFARFLLENGLLVDVEAGNSPVRRDELREIAEAEGRDVAEVAAEFAGPMLPEIFPKDDPVLALTLPPETRHRLWDLVEGLPAQTFKADDSLGWGYQYWQSAQKEEYELAAKSSLKVGADELPAVTQLFTEDYMVLFLLENTLGAWWASRKLTENHELARDATDEAELRRRLSPPGYAWSYLRFVREDDVWRPAAGAFHGWPEQASAITVLDPCMGSGHFLVFALDILVALRKAEEGLDDEAAVMSVLRDNLHGLEVDPRCTQIAAFALALAAWKRLGGVRQLPTLHLACSGLAIGMGKAEFVRLAEKIAEAEGFAGGPGDLLGRERTPIEEHAMVRRRGGLERLYEMFAQAPILGSLIEPRRALGDYGTLFSEGFDTLAGVIGKVLSRPDGDPEIREAAVTAQGLAKAAELLSSQYTLISTNVPFLGKSKQSDVLQKFSRDYYPDAAADLTSTFIRRIARLQKAGGFFAVVTPVAWWLQTNYMRMRLEYFRDSKIRLSVDLGPAAFSEMNWWAQVTVLTISEVSRDPASVSYVNASGGKWPEAKSPSTVSSPINVFKHEKMFANPDHRIALPSDMKGEPLSRFGRGLQGIASADRDRYMFCFWELDRIHEQWAAIQGSVREHCHFGGREYLLRWERGKGTLAASPAARVQGLDALQAKGVVISQMNKLPCTIHGGTLFDNNCSVLIVDDQKNLLPVWCYLTSQDFYEQIRLIEKKVSVTNASFGKVPFDLEYWQQMASSRYPDGLPKPYSNDPTQWLFDGHPRGSADPNTLDSSNRSTRPGMAEHPIQVAVARLLGYRWPRQTGSFFADCPVVGDRDEIEQAGIVDVDGIVSLPAIHGEPAAHERVRAVLKAAWGLDWADGVERACLEAEGWDKDLESWLADGFFDGHCKLFHQTPFIWHIWDGVKGGFSALVNYHKLCAPNGQGRRLLEKLSDTYLGEWIGIQRRLVTSGDVTAEDRLAAAEHLRDELMAIIEGKPPYDIFVRWKPLHQQPIGWEPDINDGVRLNIRPFLTATTWRAKAKKACILRVVPGVKKHEGADRGGEPYRDRDDYPWFWAEDHDVATLDFAGGPEFNGRRYNDFHFTRSFKQAARDRKASGSTPGSEAAE